MQNNGAKMREKSVKMCSFYYKFINIIEYNFHKSSCLLCPVFNVLSQDYKKRRKIVNRRGACVKATR